MINAWRIDRLIHRETAFRVKGRSFTVVGGTAMCPVVYTAEHKSLAMLEVLVHLHKPRSYDLYMVSFDEALVQELAFHDLPSNWNVEPSYRYPKDR